MNESFEHLLITRQRYRDLLNALTAEQLMCIPDSHNNSILWNYGHVVVTQHLLSFGLCGLELQIPMELVDKYRKGSKPGEVVLSLNDLDYFKLKEEELIHKTQSGLETGLFENFKNYTTSYGVELKSIEEAILFNNIHEGLHLGYAMALRKLI